jgi:hypothetical protein
VGFGMRAPETPTRTVREVTKYHTDVALDLNHSAVQRLFDAGSKRGLRGVQQCSPSATNEAGNNCVTTNLI